MLSDNVKQFQQLGQKLKLERGCGSLDSLPVLSSDPSLDVVRNHCLPGLQVGWIFTDLLSEDTRIGTVRYTRNKVRPRLRTGFASFLPA